MSKFIFSVVLLATAVGFLYACQPDFKAFQLANTNRPCTQCTEIYFNMDCQSDLHNSSFTCVPPVIDYSLSLTEKPCVRASVLCAGKPGIDQAAVVVAKLKSNASVPVYGAISSLQSMNAHLVLRCDHEHRWIQTDLEGNELEEPVLLQCAYNQPYTVIGV